MRDTLDKISKRQLALKKKMRALRYDFEQLTAKAPPPRAGERERYTNTRGQVIPLHHAFKRIRFGMDAQLTMVLLPIFFCFTYLVLFDPILHFWADMFRFWLDVLKPEAKVAYRIVDLVGQRFSMPFPDLSVALPSAEAVWLNFAITVIAFMATFVLPRIALPAAYLVRAMLLIQCSASIHFFISPGWFPYNLEHYITDALGLGTILLFLIPLMLSGIFYIFDVPLWHKCAITLLMFFYFILFVPVQYMLHAWIIHLGGYIMLPLMYFMFGVLLDVLMFIALYSWAMSWQKKPADDLGRFA